VKNSSTTNAGSAYRMRKEPVMRTIRLVPPLVLLACLASACLKESLKEECTSDSDCLPGHSCELQSCRAPEVLPDGGAGTPGVDALSGDQAPAAACNDDGTVVPFESVDQAMPLVVGRWTRCGGGEPSGFKGRSIELAADGQWFDLRASGADFVRQTGLGKAGTYRIRLSQGQGPAGGPPPPPTFVIEFFYNNTGSSYLTNIALTTDPRVMQLGPDLMSPLP
jgi:hypothetical protein